MYIFNLIFIQLDIAYLGSYYKKDNISIIGIPVMYHISQYIYFVYNIVSHVYMFVT